MSKPPDALPATPASEQLLEFQPSPAACGIPRLTAGQREQLRTMLRTAVFAYKRGWTEDDVVIAIGSIIADQPHPGR